MTASEIREIQRSSAAALTGDRETILGSIEAGKLDMMFEIAAQLAELNETLAPLSDYYKSIKGLHGPVS